MILADVHCHLADENFEKPMDEIIASAEKEGVRAIVTHGLGPQDNKKQVELAKRYGIVRPALGLYPGEAENLSPEDLKREADWIRSRKGIAAVGEIGLDKKESPSDAAWKRQLAAFREMLSVAEDLNRPVVVHSRKAEKDCLDELKRFEGKVVMHCFGGSMKLLKEGLDRGYMFSVPPIVVYSTHFQELVRRTDISHLLTETDAPYLSPFKDRMSEPAFVKLAVKKIAELKGFEVVDTANSIFQNFMRTF
ncbi:TatD family deoxyribonuclease [Candidatus Woesearchaeota archaeon]|nr:MAG: TatD family deoxyribonuclease [Candidatus Woesearchaeota archaeon]